MPAIQAPTTQDATTEIQGRIEVIDNQITEADRMVHYFEAQAQSQVQAGNALRTLRASYAGLLEDAGAGTKPSPQKASQTPK